MCNLSTLCTYQLMLWTPLQVVYKHQNILAPTCIPTVYLKSAAVYTISSLKNSDQMRCCEKEPCFPKALSDKPAHQRFNSSHPVWLMTLERQSLCSILQTPNQWLRFSLRIKKKICVCVLKLLLDVPVFSFNSYLCWDWILIAALWHRQ